MPPSVSTQMTYLDQLNQQVKELEPCETISVDRYLFSGQTLLNQVRQFPVTDSSSLYRRISTDEQETPPQSISSSSALPSAQCLASLEGDPAIHVCASLMIYTIPKHPGFTKSERVQYYKRVYVPFESSEGKLPRN